MTGNLLLVYDDLFLEHLPPSDHPDSPLRLEAIVREFESSGLCHSVRKIAPRPATDQELARVHNARYLDDLATSCKIAEERGCAIQLDADTWISARTLEVCRLAAGAGCLAVESVSKGKESNAFVLVRPGGHHALRHQALGFCFINNVAVAARHALEKLGMQRVLIIDWDVHHGNGTQASFYYDPSVCFISLHQYPLWPTDTSSYSEDGGNSGKGFNINIPLPAGTGDRGYLNAWDSLVEPIAREFSPQLILLSAGYDAHELDPLGMQRVSSAGYFLLSRRLAELGDAHHAPVVAFLEGGYNHQALADAVVTTIGVLNCRGTHERDELVFPGGERGRDVKPETEDRDSFLVDKRIEDLVHYFSLYWNLLR